MARRFLVGLISGMVIIASGWFVWSKVRPARSVVSEAPLSFERANAEAQKFWSAQEYVRLDTVGSVQELAAGLRGPIDGAVAGCGEEDRADLARLIASELWIHRPGATLDQYIGFVESDPSMRWIDEANPEDGWYIKLLRHSYLEEPVPERVQGEWALRQCWAEFEEKDRVVAIGAGENVFVKPFVAKGDVLTESMLALDPRRLRRFFPRGVPGSKAVTFRVPRVSAEEVLNREGSVRCVAVCMLVRTNLDHGANVYFVAFYDPGSGLWAIEYGMRIQSDRVFMVY